LFALPPPLWFLNVVANDSVLRDGVRSAWVSGDLSPIRITVAASTGPAESGSVTLSALSAMAGKGETAKVLAQVLADKSIVDTWPGVGHASQGNVRALYGEHLP
jgi:hypothetical protein